jgi:hypothetical protein
VAPVVRVVDWHDDLVALADLDQMVAAGTAIPLVRLIRLHMANLDGVAVASPH